MTPRELQEAIDANMVLQEAALQAREGYECLYRAALMRGQMELALNNRELTLAAMEELLDLQAIGFELQSRIK